MKKRFFILALLASPSCVPSVASDVWSSVSPSGRFSTTIQAQRLHAYADSLDGMLVEPKAFAPVPDAADDYWRNAIPEEMRRSYIAEAEPLIGKPWPALPASAFAQFKVNGNRTVYEGLCFEKRRHLALLVMAEIMEWKGRFLADIIDGLQSFCEESWWGLPAHYGSLVPLYDDQNVDLFNAETACLVGWSVYMLRQRLEAFSPLFVKRLDGEIAHRILLPARTGKYWWKSAGMNWNPWICSNWLYCVLLYEHDRQHQLDAVRQILDATDAFMDAYPDDGGCDEGPGYWDRAAASMFEVLYTLKLATGGRIDLSTNRKVRSMGAYVYKTYIQNDYCTTFADIHTNHAVVQPATLFPFGRFIDDAVMKSFAAYAGQKQDIVKTAGARFRDSHNFPSMARELTFLGMLGDYLSEKPAEPMLADVWLPALQIMAARRGRLYVAMKGGHNGESHNHNDVGSFIVYADGQPLIIDPGVGEYTSQTFSDNRYSIWTMQSAYHNLPQINGTDQRDGKQYGAQVVSYKPGQLCLQIAGAYPPEARVDSWRRTLSLGSNALTITEDYSLRREGRGGGREEREYTRLMLITLSLPRINQAGSIDIGSCRLTYNPRQLEAAIEDISSLTDAHLQGVWGKHMYRMVLTVKDQKAEDKIVYRIIPIKGKER